MSTATQCIVSSGRKNQTKPIASKVRRSKYQSTRPANDVTQIEVNCPAAALTFYRFKQQPFLIEDQVLADLASDVAISFQKQVIEKLSIRVELISDFYRSGLLSDEIMQEGIESLKAGDTVALAGWVSDVFKVAKACLVQKVMEDVKSLVLGLPFGSDIWVELSRSEFYGFFIDESDDGATLRYSALDFFGHYDIDANRLSPHAKKAYMMLITKLLSFGDGAWQHDVCSYGRWDFVVPKSQEEIDVIIEFVNEIQAIEVSEASAFLQGWNTEGIKKFIETVEESYYLELADMIEEEKEDDFECMKENMLSAVDYLKAEFACKALGIASGTASWHEIADELNQLEDAHCETVKLLKSVFSQSTLFSEDEAERAKQFDVLTSVEETHPGFGIVLCPFDDGTVEGEALNALSREMEVQFMESGEFDDSWIINTGHADWVNVILQRTKATALLMSLIVGHATVLKPKA